MGYIAQYPPGPQNIPFHFDYLLGADHLVVIGVDQASDLGKDIKDEAAPFGVETLFLCPSKSQDLVTIFSETSDTLPSVGFPPRTVVLLFSHIYRGSQAKLKSIEKFTYGCDATENPPWLFLAKLPY